MNRWRLLTVSSAPLAGLEVAGCLDSGTEQIVFDETRLVEGEIE
ncbi:hypothetical protein [Saliphagus infecundisoli]|uniref:Uncharacterized protein n=1 Tax=Saliphagus infecundisoli TaxID=1849069 RepID=A0ABD5QAY4_9EURY|nr:hypothetical protein [Saliphagus infecundisoli]